MTLRSSDLQSDSDLDSIGNSCDVWKAWPRFRSILGKSFFLKIPRLFVRCPTSFWPPPNPFPSVKRGLRNTFGHFFTVFCTNQLSIWTWLFVSNRCSKSSWQEFWGTKLKKMPILTWKRCSKPSGPGKRAMPNYKKIQKGTSFILLSYW